MDKEMESSFDINIENAINEKDGIHLVDFSINKYLAYRQISLNNYIFIIMVKKYDEIVYVESFTGKVIDFLKKFDFKKWCLSITAFGKITYSEILPLVIFAKENGDIFLEYEIKYYFDKASQEEIDYLNNKDGDSHEPRFALKKDLYDIDDIIIKSVDFYIKKWYGEVYKLDIIIDDVERNAQFHFNTDEIPAYLSLRPFGKIIKCNITERLANIIKGLFTK